MSKLVTFTCHEVEGSADEFYVDSKFSQGEPMYTFTNAHTSLLRGSSHTTAHFQVRVEAGVRVKRSDNKAWHVPMALVRSFGLLNQPTGFGTAREGDESFWRSRFAKKLQMEAESYAQLVKRLAGGDLHEVFRAVDDWTQHVAKGTREFHEELVSFQNALMPSASPLDAVVLETTRLDGWPSPQSSVALQLRLSLYGTDTDKACMYTLPPQLASNPRVSPAIFVELRKDGSELLTPKLITWSGVPGGPSFQHSVTASTASAGTNTILPWKANHPPGILAALKRNKDEVEAQMT